jgi:hypothetical protein
MIRGAVGWGDEVTVHGMIATTLSQPVENPRLLRFDAAFRKPGRFEHPRHLAAEGTPGLANVSETELIDCG